MYSRCAKKIKKIAIYCMACTFAEKNLAVNLLLIILVLNTKG